MTLAGNIQAMRYERFRPQFGQSYVIINNDGVDPVSGTFSGLAEGASFISGGVSYSVSYTGGDGNDVVLSALSTAYIVTNTNDSGAGSLRQAILGANATPESDFIDFSLSGAGPYTFAPGSALPVIISPLCIDATVLSGYSGTPLIEIRGDSAGSGASGLTLGSGSNGSAVSGLAINRFRGDGIVVTSAGNLSGKILVDCTNPLKPDLSGLAVGPDSSAAEQVAQWARGARVVKCFNTTGAENMTNPHFGNDRAVMFLAGDDDTAKATVTKLGDELGFEMVDAGGLSIARLLEPVAMLWIHLAFRRALGRDFAFKLLRR